MVSLARDFSFYFNLFSMGDTVCVVSNIDSHQEYCGPEIGLSKKKIPLICLTPVNWDLVPLPLATPRGPPYIG